MQTVLQGMQQVFWCVVDYFCFCMMQVLSFPLSSFNDVKQTCFYPLIFMKGLYFWDMMMHRVL